MDNKPNITIYTDGACSGNPGPGGYGVILRDSEGREKELSEGFRRTTNNRMELRAVIVGLEALKRPSHVRIVTDSQYVVNSIEKKWLDGWIKKGWRKADKSPVLNIDLWKRLLPKLKEHSVSFTWVRGHAGHPENERCDALAVAASQGNNLLDDTSEE